MVTEIQFITSEHTLSYLQVHKSVCTAVYVYMCCVYVRVRVRVCVCVCTCDTTYRYDSARGCNVCGSRPQSSYQRAVTPAPALLQQRRHTSE